MRGLFSPGPVDSARDFETRGAKINSAPPHFSVVNYCNLNSIVLRSRSGEGRKANESAFEGPKFNRVNRHLNALYFSFNFITIYYIY